MCIQTISFIIYYEYTMNKIEEFVEYAKRIKKSLGPVILWDPLPNCPDKKEEVEINPEDFNPESWTYVKN